MLTQTVVVPVNIAVALPTALLAQNAEMRRFALREAAALARRAAAWALGGRICLRLCCWCCWCCRCCAGITGKVAPEKDTEESPEVPPV